MLYLCHTPLDDVLGSSSSTSPHLGPLPMGEEESSFTLLQVRGAVAEDVTKRRPCKRI